MKQIKLKVRPHVVEARKRFLQEAKKRTKAQLVEDYADAMVISLNQAVTLMEFFAKHKQIVEMLK